MTTTDGEVFLGADGAREEREGERHGKKREKKEKRNDRIHDGKSLREM